MPAKGDAVATQGHDRRCIALTQLETALRLYFERQDYYSVVALAGAAMRLVVQGVGTRFDSYFDRAFRDDETRQSRLVLIGMNLDAAVLQAELERDLLVTPLI